MSLQGSRLACVSQALESALAVDLAERRQAEAFLEREQQEVGFAEALLAQLQEEHDADNAQCPPSTAAVEIPAEPAYQPHPTNRPPKRVRPVRPDDAEWYELSKGLVVLRGFLSTDEQCALAAQCLPLVQPTALCKNEVTKNMKQITIGKQKTANAGASTAIPNIVAECATAACAAACELSSCLTMLRPRTCVLNWYPPNGKLGRHVDKKGRRRGVPVVSFSIGSTANFVYQQSWSKKSAVSTVELRSGDALVFGGPSEGIVHSVPHIMPGKVHLSPELALEGRLNITVREH